MQLSWSHALFQVHNLDAMIDFYTDVLGFDVTDRGAINDGKTELVFLSQNASDHHQIGFASGRHPDARPPRGNHFAFRVESLADVKTWYARLDRDARVPSASPVTHGNAWSVYFNDPDGNGIEVFCDTPWHVSQPQGGTWDPTASDEDIHAETEARFREDPEFQPIHDFYHQRAEKLSQ